MSYQSALEAAGAKIIAFQYFGSYQGDWFAKVNFNGDIGWVRGSYGSCSGCDAFEAEFGWSCDEESDEYKVRLAAFGKTYLDGIYPQNTQEKLLEDEIAEWDWMEDEKEMLAFVVANR